MPHFSFRSEKSNSHVEVDVEFIRDSVDNVYNDTNNIDFIVSPANCHGFMDGGIDAYYMKLFPGIQQRVEAKIATYNIESPLFGRPVLPIGSCVPVKTMNLKIPYLLSVPTMFLPEKIDGTQNVYHAFLSILLYLAEIVKQLQNHDNLQIIIACPCLGTGIGQMSYKESGKQINSAIYDFMHETHKLNTNIISKSVGGFVLRSHGTGEVLR